ncbi:MAG: alanine--tRNA ligase [Polyangiaceae bacterium]
MSQTASDIRKAFLDFFAAREHRVVESGPLVPPNDPSLMFANAGMVQFKDLFTGKEARDYTRATSAQKCIRISGKHNDLEAVGPSPRHHTFFEMLGNFSFGDYFKEEAIVYAWEFLTGTLGLPKDRLVCTYFGGEDGIPADTEARDLWKKLTGFGDDRVIGLGKADNFWQAGDTGPCGPSSEIHIYQGGSGDIDFGSFGDEQTPEGVGWMELWNLVFMQYDRPSKDAELQPLPKPSIDTGAGLERLACVLQGKTNNYDIDLLRELVECAAQISGKPYGHTMAPDDVSMRVIADHSRLTAFLISEGILPDRDGRPYVLRRVMRRAIRHGHRLGIEQPFLHQVALKVAELMGEQYPQLNERRDLIASVAEQEEVRFRRTIQRGLGLLDERFAALDDAEQKTLAGDDAFKLYDTFGFPLDLTEVICAERGYEVDKQGYEAALQKAKEQSQWAGQEKAITDVYRDAASKLPEGGVRFTGYERTEERSKLLAILKDGELLEQLEGSALEGVELVVSSTPFYAESGGQAGDSGVIVAEGVRFVVHDTQRPISGLVVHKGTLEQGSLKLGDELDLQVDSAKRDATRKNHSATHLLHLALRRVLGEHAQQKGSLVGPDRLRFDFTHGEPLTLQQIREIEDLVNERVQWSAPIQTEVLSMEQAKERGAMMIFEEKYGDTVRLLSIADSLELCGGTHAKNTGDVGLFKILSESGVAAGVRRIEAATGMNAVAHVRAVEDQLSRAAKVAKSGGGDLAEKIERILAHDKQLEKKIEELQRKLMEGGGSGGMDALLASARDVGGAKVLSVQTEITDRGALRELAEKLRDRLGDSVVLVGSAAEGKAQLVLTVSKSLTSRFQAGNLIKSVAEKVGGSGGGRPDMAQAGGTDVTQLGAAIESLYSVVEQTTSP